jgi:tRNA (adenine57-N1/adenine58-N1)-methyltransferase
MKKPEFHFPKLLKKAKRGGPAVTLPKDAGLVIGYTGIGRKSRVLELGSGSGFMTIQLANVAAEVVSYEKREEFLELSKKNVERAGLDNVTFKHQDVLEKPPEESGEFDLIFCDIAQCEKLVEKLHGMIAEGGFLSSHCLNIEQAKELVLECEKHFADVFMMEAIVREYDVRDFGTRPKHFGLMHSAYMVFAKK